MVYYDIRRLWTKFEWEKHLEFGRMHCARLGFKTWKKQGKNFFNFTNFDFFKTFLFYFFFRATKLGNVNDVI